MCDDYSYDFKPRKSLFDIPCQQDFNSWGCRNTCICTKFSYERSYDRAAHIRADARAFEAPRLYQLLGETLRGLPNLSSIEIRGRKPRYAEHHPTVCAQTALKYKRLVLKEEWYEDCGRAQFQFLMRALLAAGKKFQLKTLLIKYGGNECGRYERFGFKTSVQGGVLSPSTSSYFKDYFSLARKTLRYLETVEWEYSLDSQALTGYNKDFKSTKDANDKLWHKMLSSMPRLKVLTLTRLGTKGCKGKDLYIRNVFSNRRWTALHSLTLRNMELDGSELIQFLSRHSPTLRVLELASLTLVLPCSFQAFIQFLRLRLSLTCFTMPEVHVEIYQLHYASLLGNLRMEDGKALRDALGDYVVKKRSAYPLASRRVSEAYCRQRFSPWWMYSAVAPRRERVVDGEDLESVDVEEWESEEEEVVSDGEYFDEEEFLLWDKNNNDSKA